MQTNHASFHLPPHTAADQAALNGHNGHHGQNGHAPGSGLNGLNGRSAAASATAPDTTEAKLARLKALRAEAKAGAGPAAVARQHRAGKLTARERLAFLLDRGSFQEIDGLVRHRETRFGMADRRYLGDSVITGWGTINGRPVYVYSQDFTVFGGSVGRVHADKICKLLDLALKNGAPVIGINDSGGARIQEGVVGLGGYADIFLRNTLASGVVPQISLIMGPCAGGAVYSPALTDFICMVEGSSHMFVTGPEVVKAVTGEDVTFEQLGGAAMHNAVSGVAHLSAVGEYEALHTVRRLCDYLPANHLADAPMAAVVEPTGPAELLDGIVPDSPAQPYDIKEVIRLIVDGDSFFEIHAQYAPNLVVGFARLGGQTVGLVANQPLVLAGALDVDAARKGARFVRFCDAFNIPLVVLEDVPGFMPGLDQEEGGIIREGAKLLYAFCEATVPKVTVVTRKAYGGAYLTMNCKQIRSDLNLAWPTAELAVMGPEGAVNVMFRRELAQAAEPERLRAERVAEYRELFANPYVAAEHGYIDDVILPSETRERLIDALQMLRHKRDANPPKKHSTMPL